MEHVAAIDITIGIDRLPQCRDDAVVLVPTQKLGAPEPESLGVTIHHVVAAAFFW